MLAEGFVYRRPKHTLKGKRNERAFRKAQRALNRLKKGLAYDADYELWYQDESEFHLHSHLTYAWMPKGKQMRVPSPGKNRKHTVLGAFCYGRGLFYHHIQPRKTAWGVRALLQKLVRRAKRTGRRIILVMDRGNSYHAKALQRDLENIKDYIEVFWLPYHCPDLNLIEMLWKHLKHSRMANILFSSFTQFTEHLSVALDDFACHPDFTLSIATPKCRETIRKNYP